MQQCWSQYWVETDSKTNTAIWGPKETNEFWWASYSNGHPRLTLLVVRIQNTLKCASIQGRDWVFKKHTSGWKEWNASRIFKRNISFSVEYKTTRHIFWYHSFKDTVCYNAPEYFRSTRQAWCTLRICQRDYWREVFEHSHDEYSRFARGIVRDSNTLGLRRGITITYTQEYFGFCAL